MVRLRLLLCLAAATPAAAGAQEWRPSRDYDVLLSNFDIQPETIVLKAGETVRLRLVNNSPTPHSFVADALFRTAQIRPRDRKLGEDRIEIAPGETREVVLIPAAGRSSAHCANMLHRIMGMRARIVVE